MTALKKFNVVFLLSLIIITFLVLAHNQAFGANEDHNLAWPEESHSFFYKDPALFFKVVISGSPYDSFIYRKILEFKLIYDPEKLSLSKNQEILRYLFGTKQIYNLQKSDVYFEKKTHEQTAKPNATIGGPSTEDLKLDSFIIRFVANRKIEEELPSELKLPLAYLEFSNNGYVRFVSKSEDNFFNAQKTFLPVDSYSVNVRPKLQQNIGCKAGPCVEADNYLSLKEGMHSDVNFAVAFSSKNAIGRVAWTESADKSIAVKQLLLEVGESVGQELQIEQQSTMLSDLSLMSLQRLTSKVLTSKWQRKKITTYTIADLQSANVELIPEEASSLITLNLGDVNLQFLAKAEAEHLQVSLNNEVQAPLLVDVRQFTESTILNIQPNLKHINASANINTNANTDKYSTIDSPAKILNDPALNFKNYFREKYLSELRLSETRYDEIQEIAMSYYSALLENYLKTNPKLEVSEITENDINNFLANIRLPSDKSIRELIFAKYLPLPADTNQNRIMKFFSDIKIKEVLKQRDAITKEINNVEHNNLIVDNYFLLKKMINEYFIYNNQELKQIVHKQLMAKFQKASNLPVVLETADLSDPNSSDLQVQLCENIL